MPPQTGRLSFRRLIQEGYRDLAGILQDPRVMYAYEHTFSGRDVREWLDRQRMRYVTSGLGLYAVVLWATEELIGQAGLTMQPCEGNPVLEPGYLLKKTAWGKGYAGETAEFWKSYAFHHLEREKVYSVIKADNASSIRVAESIGMKKEKSFLTRYYAGERLHFLYSATRAGQST